MFVVFESIITNWLHEQLLLIYNDIELIMKIDYHKIKSICVYPS